MAADTDPRRPALPVLVGVAVLLVGGLVGGYVLMTRDPRPADRPVAAGSARPSASPSSVATVAATAAEASAGPTFTTAYPSTTALPKRRPRGTATASVVPTRSLVTIPGHVVRRTLSVSAPRRHPATTSAAPRPTRTATPRPPGPTATPPTRPPSSSPPPPPPPPPSPTCRPRDQHPSTGPKLPPCPKH